MSDDSRTDPGNGSVVDRCPLDGQFYSERTASRHAGCFRDLAREESGLHELYGVVQGAIRP